MGFFSFLGLIFLLDAVVSIEVLTVFLVVESIGGSVSSVVSTVVESVDWAIIQLEKNKILIEINDSISTANNLLENQISLLEVDVETVNSKLIDNEKEINKLKRNKGEIYKHVNSLDVDGVTSGLSD